MMNQEKSQRFVSLSRPPVVSPVIAPPVGTFPFAPVVAPLSKCLLGRLLLLHLSLTTCVFLQRSCVG